MKAYYVLLTGLSVFFLIISILAVFGISDILSLVVLLLQVFLLANLVWLSWEKFRKEKE
jgi:threonine/homoserine/homoserine lactone efflux protein